MTLEPGKSPSRMEFWVSQLGILITIVGIVLSSYISLVKDGTSQQVRIQMLEKELDKEQIKNEQKMQKIDEKFDKIMEKLNEIDKKTSK